MQTLDISEVTENIRNHFSIGNGHFLESRNEIVEYISDEFIDSNRYDSMESLILDLEMAHCAAGSFPGMIYTRDILDRLADRDWQNAIEQAIEDYTDATGESPEFDRDCMGHRDTFRMENLVTFAVDWYSNEIASFLRSNGEFYVVTEVVDSFDPSPVRKVFFCEYEAEDWVTVGIQARVDYRIQHSAESVSGAEYDAMVEEESECFTINMESV